MSQTAVLPIDSCREDPAAGLDAALASRARPYPLALNVAGAVVILLALAALDDLSALWVLMLVCLGTAMLVGGWRWAAHLAAAERRRVRSILDALPVESLVRASWSPRLHEKTRILIVNYVNAYHPGRSLLPSGEDADLPDLRQLGEPRGGCGGGCRSSRCG